MHQLPHSTVSQESFYRGLRIAIVVPCHNEEVTVGAVIDGFRAVMPQASVHIFDNLSTDQTAAVARSKDAHVWHVGYKGKGNVVRRIFADVDADIYVMVDGDATYHASSVCRLVDTLIDARMDMVVGSRVEEEQSTGEAYRSGHRFGNRLLTGCVQMIFGGAFTDMLSGYRAFSRRYAKSFPAMSRGFEIETELTVHALELRMPCAEIDTPYGARPEGSISKLSTYRDGWRILMTIGRLVMSEKPLQFFGLLGGLLLLTAVGISSPIVFEYLETGMVRRFPTLSLVTVFLLSATVSFVCGLILHTVTHMRQELKRFAYLAVPGIGAAKQ